MFSGGTLPAQIVRALGFIGLVPGAAGSGIVCPNADTAISRTKGMNNRTDFIAPSATKHSLSQRNESGNELGRAKRFLMKTFRLDDRASRARRSLTLIPASLFLYILCVVS